MQDDRIVAGGAAREEDIQDRAIRPRRLVDYVGQAAVKAQLDIFVSAARGRGEALEAGDTVRRHREHLDTFGTRLRREHHGVDAEGLAHEREGLTRCACSETFDVHAVPPMIEPIRIEWVSGISL